MSADTGMTVGQPSDFEIEVDGQEYATLDYGDALMAIGSAVLGRAQHITVRLGTITMTDATITHAEQEQAQP